jgi:hypothetical protein
MTEEVKVVTEEKEFFVNRIYKARYESYFNERYIWQGTRRRTEYDQVVVMTTEEATLGCVLGWLFRSGNYDSGRRGCSLVVVSKNLDSAWVFNTDYYTSMCGGVLISVERHSCPRDSAQSDTGMTARHANSYINTSSGSNRDAYDELSAGLVAMRVGVGACTLNVVKELLDYLANTPGTTHATTACRWGNNGVYLFNIRRDDAEADPAYANCGYCGYETDEDGYCEECDEYAYHPDNEDDLGIDSRKDYLIRGWSQDCPTDDVVGLTYDELVPGLVRDMEGGAIFNWVPRSYYSSVKVNNARGLVVTSCWVGRGIDDGVFRHPKQQAVIFAARLRELMRGLQGNGILISTNVGMPEVPGTLEVMKFLINHEKLMSEYGIKLLYADDLATNPNCNHHFIDQLYVYPVSDRGAY